MIFLGFTRVNDKEFVQMFRSGPQIILSRIERPFNLLDKVILDIPKEARGSNLDVVKAFSYLFTKSGGIVKSILEDDD